MTIGKRIVSILAVSFYTVVDVVMFYTITEWWLHLDRTLAAVIVLAASVNAVRNMIEERL